MCFILGVVIQNNVIYFVVLWPWGFSMIWIIISGLDRSCCCIWFWSSEKLVELKPKLLRPASPPRLPKPNGLLFVEIGVELLLGVDAVVVLVPAALLGCVD